MTPSLRPTARLAARPTHRSRRRFTVVALAAVVLVAAVACQPPVLGPPPSLPAAGTCNSGPGTCCPPGLSGLAYYGNLRYGHDVDENQDLLVDAYVPTGASGPRPAVVYVHGGGHVGGNKCDNGNVLDYLAQHGFAVFSIDYPLASSTVHPFSEQPADTELAVQWVRTNAASFGVNPSAIALFGTSAGVDIAFDAAYEAQRSDPAARVEAVAGWSGVYDFVDEYYRDPSNPDHVGNGTDYLGCIDLADQGCFAIAQATSPVTYASHDDPPTLVATSTDFTTGCESVEPQNAIEMVDALQARGAPVVLETNHACAHAAGYVKAKIDPPGTGTMIDNLIAFFDQQLGPSPTPPTTPAPLPPRRSGPSITTASSTCAPDAPGVTYQSNIVYGRDFSNPLHADVYRPAGVTSARPAVLVVHGGDYTSGDKCDAGPATAAVLLAQHGYVAFTLDYPLATATQATFPNPVYDVMDAVAALKANAATYGVDPSHVGLWGGDSGADLALAAATAAPLVEPAAGVAAVVNDSGTTDIFERQGEYTAAGMVDPDATWTSELGCADPVAIAWNPTANTCFTTYQQASPALLTDALGGSFGAPPAVLEEASARFDASGTCETDPPRQAEEMQWRASTVGWTTTLAYPDECASGFGYLDTQSGTTLSFLAAHLGS